MINKYALAIAGLVFGLLSTKAQSKQELINNIAEDIKEGYFAKAMGQQIADSLIYKLEIGEYDTNTTLTKDEFLYQVLQDIRQQSQDKHFFLAGANINPPQKQAKNLRKAFIDRFYYRQIQIWDKNIAYLAFDNFQDQLYEHKSKQKRRPLHKVLKTISHLDTIVIDLRYNRGGKAYMGAYLVAHFLEKPEQYLFSTVEYSKDGKEKIETDFKTPTIQIKPLVNKKIYLLTSRYTFSAAELAVYELKKYIPNLEIIGEKTAGGANGHLGKKHQKGYCIQIPNFSIFDKENSNYTWEGKGLEPNIYASIGSALVVLIQKIRKGKKDIAISKNLLDQTKKIRKTKNPQDYIGNYSIANISSQNGYLYLQYDIKPPTILNPITKKGVFCTLEFKSIRFEQDENQEIKGIYIERNDGYTEYYKKKLD